MKFLINVSPNFYRFAPHVLREISQDYPNMSFKAVVQGGASVYNGFLERTSDLNAVDVEDFNMLEKKWLSKPASTTNLRKYEQLLGENAVNRIIVADRLVGWRYLTGGDIPKTPLADYCENASVRSAYVCNLLDYLFNIFKTQKPDVVFTYAVAGAFTMALSLVTEHFSVEFRRLNEIRLKDRCILDESFLNMATPVKALYEKSLSDDSIIKGSRQAAKKFLAEMREKPAPPNYYWVVQSKVLTLPPLKDFIALLWWSISRRPVDSLSTPYHMERFWWELRRYVKANLTLKSKMFEEWPPEEKTSPFVYYPLHHDPEASTMVLAPHATNQLSVIEALSKAIPAEWNLVVKEHFVMLGRRPVNFYKRLRKIPKVKLVKPSANSFELILNSEFVATITGTVAWEAMIFGKPALCLGRAHFQNVGHGVVVEENLHNLASAVETTIKLPPAPERNLELYVASMFEASFPLRSEIVSDVSASDEFLRNQKISIHAISQGLIKAFFERKTREKSAKDSTF